MEFKAFFKYINYTPIHSFALGFTLNVIPIFQRDN